MDTKIKQDAVGLLGRTFSRCILPRIYESFDIRPYELFGMESEEVPHFIKYEPWKLLHVTSPYMQAAAQCADEVSKNVFATGVADTLIKRDDGSVFAENTNVAGIERMLDVFAKNYYQTDATSLFSDSKVLIYGYGPQSKAFAQILTSLKSHVFNVSGQGQELNYELASCHKDAKFIVNTTSLGSYPNCPFSSFNDDDIRLLPQLLGVLDVISNPRLTGICLLAEKHNIPALGGLPLITSQAAYAIKKLTQKTLSSEELDMFDLRCDQSLENIVLIGMPSAGKTTTGRILAKQLSRPFVDIDEAICLEYGCTTEYLIQYDGVDKFRDKETELCKKYGSQRGIVIACGGGVVTRDPNYDLLHQNGRLLFLDRPLNELIMDGRPISQSQGINKLASERMGLYHSWSDVRLTTSGSPEQDAKRAADILGYQIN